VANQFGRDLRRALSSRLGTRGRREARGNSARAPLVFEVLEQTCPALECGGFADARSGQKDRAMKGGEQASTERRWQNGAVNLLFSPKKR
jgi:hypothetical protein